MIRSHTGKAFETMPSVDITTYYRLLEKKYTFNTKWLSEFQIPNKDILSSWWKYPSKLWVKVDQVYMTKCLRNFYQFMVAMMNQLYRRSYIDTFLRTWVPIMYTITTRGIIFNWKGILASTLKTNIYAVKNQEADQPSEFYMESYLLDVVCARFNFDGWSYN